MRKNKLLLLLALLMTAATGAWAQDETYPIVYDFEAAANAGENPGNKNGAGGTGQGFYGWESANYKDRVRQDYKGYDWATGSVLPKVCHVWRRSDRINGNVAGNGGLKCPSDKEMAVDGLTEGLTVTIIYDATNASSKEIVWAIGDGSSELLSEPRATATINGAEAVPGTTTIKSGDVITVTKVTPATNGSGYIVFKVMKDMVIKKIIIDEAKAASGYTVSMKDGVKDADKWTVKVGEGQAQALPIGGLKGDGKETVTLKYNGRLKVKGVTATSEAAAPSVPDVALSGVFSVSGSKQVNFSKGNLRYASSKWSFFDNQYDFYTGYSADAWDKFGWSTSATTYGMNTSANSSDYSGDFVDWGATMGTGWFTLTSDEWTYLLNTRSASTVGGTANGRYAKAKVNDVQGVILFPDTYTHPDGVTAPVGVNATDNTGWNGNSYTAADWTKMESAGCVFLPAAGRRNGSMVTQTGTYGDYWSATPNGTDYVYNVYFSSGYLDPANFGSRYFGFSVRLVQEAK